MSKTLHLKIFYNGRLVDQRSVTQDVIKIGKLKSSHLCLEDDAVARMHAVIEVSGADVRVIDLGSSTGTMLNNERVEKNAAIQDGDVIGFGPFQVEVGITEAVASATPAQVPQQPMAAAVIPQQQPPVHAAPMGGAPVGQMGQMGQTGMGAGMAAAAPMGLGGQQPMGRPVMHVDPSEVEVHDGSTVTEVMTMYGRTVLDVQHLGQVKPRNKSAPMFLGLGGAMFLLGVGLFSYEVAQDWDSYREAVVKAQEEKLPIPAKPGIGGIELVGIALAFAGLVPFGIGIVRSEDLAPVDYTLGEAHDASFHTPTQGLPDPSAFPLVRGGEGMPATLNFTQNMSGHVTLDGQKLSLAELVSSGRALAQGGSYAFPIPSGASCKVDYEELTFFVNSVPPGRVIADKSEVDKPFWLYFAGSAAVISSFLILAQLIPSDALSMDLDDMSDENRFVGYMNQPDEEPEEEPPPEQEDSDDEAGGTGQRHKGEEGKMGKPTSKNKSGLYAMKGPKDATPQMARNFDPEMMARNAGILGLMQQESGHFLASPYGAAFAVGNDDEDVWGGLTGTEIGEAYGVGGLGLVGTGRGGGGTGEGTIGLGNVGTIGKGGGGGTGSGYGRGSGAGFGGRGKRVPRVRQAKADVKGGLDKDIIRRIVRAHIMEVRHCYNQGLVRDPNLQGRVKIQFSIGPTGTVAGAVVQESTLKDSSVANCIAKAVRRWKFPKPKGGGTAMVAYPFLLSPG